MKYRLKVILFSPLHECLSLDIKFHLEIVSDVSYRSFVKGGRPKGPLWLPQVRQMPLPFFSPEMPREDS